MNPTGATKDEVNPIDRLMDTAVYAEDVNRAVAARILIKKQLNERERLREALRDLVECSPCQNGCAPNDMRCATMKARAALNEVEG